MDPINIIIVSVILTFCLGAFLLVPKLQKPQEEVLTATDIELATLTNILDGLDQSQDPQEIINYLNLFTDAYVQIYQRAYRKALGPLDNRIILRQLALIQSQIIDLAIEIPQYPENKETIRRIQSDLKLLKLN